MNAHRQLKLLLLQARKREDAMAAHELDCFVSQCRLDPGQIHLHDVVQGPPGSSDWRRYDGLLVGGAGDYYVSKRNLPEFEAVLDFFGEVVSEGMPMFASCFGFQCLVVALGGEIAYDPANTEVGTYRLTLTASGAHDPILGCLPPEFWAQEGHKDRATRNPDGVENLASSGQSPLQAFRIPGKPVWATQFHPELTRESNLHRFHYYLEGYAQYMSDEERRQALTRFRDSPETSQLLPRFLDLVFA